MKIKEETVAKIVKEASAKMSDPNYSAVLVGTFVQSQPAASQYVSAGQKELGGAEGVVNTIFHACLLAECFKLANNRTIPELSFQDLDNGSKANDKDELKIKQPSLYEYIEQNVEQKEMQKTLRTFALAMDSVS